MTKTTLLLFVCLSLTGFSQDFHKIDLLAYGGLPKSETKGLDIDTLYNTAFITGYSDELKNPLWTCYRFGNMKGRYRATKAKKDSMFIKWERPREFKIDRRTKSRVSHDDYTSSGYDRGHMAPNSGILVQYGQMAQLETYFMTNICPQDPNLNQGIWKHLEAEAREKISQIDKKKKEVHDVFVITGPAFKSDQPKTLESGIPIPDGFYKIYAYKIGYSGTVKAVAFYFPHDKEYKKSDKNFFDYVTTVDQIEELTGLDFFPELSSRKQSNLEKKKRNFKLEDI